MVKMNTDSHINKDSEGFCAKVCCTEKVVQASIFEYATCFGENCLNSLEKCYGNADNGALLMD